MFKGTLKKPCPHTYHLSYGVSEAYKHTIRDLFWRGSWFFFFLSIQKSQLPSNIPLENNSLSDYQLVPQWVRTDNSVGIWHSGDQFSENDTRMGWLDKRRLSSLNFTCFIIFYVLCSIDRLFNGKKVIILHFIVFRKKVNNIQGWLSHSE